MTTTQKTQRLPPDALEICQKGFSVVWELGCGEREEQNLVVWATNRLLVYVYCQLLQAIWRWFLWRCAAKVATKPCVASFPLLELGRGSGYWWIPSTSEAPKVRKKRGCSSNPLEGSGVLHPMKVGSTNATRPMHCPPAWCSNKDTQISFTSTCPQVAT